MSISRSAHRRNHHQHLRNKYGAGYQTRFVKINKVHTRLVAAEEVRKTTGFLPRESNGRFVPTRTWRQKLSQMLGFGQRPQEATA